MTQSRPPRRRAPASTPAPAVAPELDLGELPTLLGYNLRRAQVALWRDFLKHVGVAGGIRPGAFALLLLVARNPGAAQVELARALSIDKASIVAVIDRLEKAQLLERRRSSVDRRRQGLFLTPAGTRRVTQLRGRMLEHEKRYLDLMTPAESRTMLRLLKRFYSA